MTATDKLRALLEERGVRWWEEDGHTLWYGESLHHAASAFSSFMFGESERVHLNAMVTPEQAVAATLGQEDAYTREDVEGAFVSGYSLGSLPVGSDPQWDQNEQTVDEHMAELGWVRKDAATLGETPTSHVEDLGRLHDELRDAIVEILGDRCDWDQNGVRHAHEVLERAATLGPGTCHMEHLWSDDVDGVCWWCKACDKPAFTHGDFPPSYCPNCGRKVVECDSK